MEANEKLRSTLSQASDEIILRAEKLFSQQLIEGRSVLIVKVLN